MGIIVSQYKDPNKPINIMECHIRVCWVDRDLPKHKGLVDQLGSILEQKKTGHS